VPGRAIFAEDETPEQWKSFIELNKKFFKDNPESSRPPSLAAHVQRRRAGPQGIHQCGRPGFAKPLVRGWHAGCRYDES
jgi:hypothetical protein